MSSVSSSAPSAGSGRINVKAITSPISSVPLVGSYPLLQRLLNGISQRFVAPDSFCKHPRQRGNLAVHIVINPNDLLIGMQPVQTAHILLQGAFPGDRPGKEQGVQPGVVKSLDVSGCSLYFWGVALVAILGRSNGPLVISLSAEFSTFSEY